MGQLLSVHALADGAAPLAAKNDTAPPPLPNFSFAASAAAVAKDIKEKERPNYLDLPQPVRYEGQAASLEGFGRPSA